MIRIIVQRPSFRLRTSKPATIRPFVNFARCRNPEALAVPKTGKGFRRLSVSIEGGLLERVEAWCKRKNLTRAQAIAQGLKMVMAEK
jgi:hypothetical protein